MEADTLGTEPSPNHVQIYTDGGCKPNPGPGGWAAVIRFTGENRPDGAPIREWFLSGNDGQATNNQMELQAAIAALGLLSGLDRQWTVDLFTDSDYLRQGITDWSSGWERNGWKTRDGQPVKNKTLWQELARLVQRHQVTWHWLKGHADHPHNERADRLAARARRELAGHAAHPPDQPTPARAVELEIFVKASYNASRRVGGWGVVLRKGDHRRTLARRESGVSANALLLRAAAEGLWALTRPCSVAVISDADYLIRGASQWLGRWQARDWQTKEGKPVANRAEWEALQAAMQHHRVSWQLARTEELPDLARAAELAAQALAADGQAAGL